MQIFITDIIANDFIAKDYKLLQIKVPKFVLDVKPGQFFAVKVNENSTDPLLRIPLSIHSREENSFSFLYKIVGQATKILSQKRAGDSLNMFGPLGNGFSFAKKNQAILVAGGYGVAPLYLLAQELAKKKIKIKVYLGANNSEQILCADKFLQLGAKVIIATNDGSQGFKGLVTEIFESDLATFANFSNLIVYASGPNLMLHALAKITNRLNIYAEFSLEAYMACGFGACCGCTIETNDGYKLCCKDGPIFPAFLFG